MRYLIPVLLIALSSVSCRTKQQDKPVQAAASASSGYVLDTVITKRIPLTVDGEWATIVYHLKVQDWKKPVEWSFNVMNGNDTVYTVVSDSSEVNHEGLFRDSEFENLFVDSLDVRKPSKPTYVGKKKYWYLVRNLSFFSDTMAARDTTGRVGWNAYSDSIFSYYKDKPVIRYTFLCASHFMEDPGAWVFDLKSKKLVCIFGP